MKQTKKSIIEACHGKIMEKADYALEQVLANINDMNTDERKKMSERKSKWRFRHR